MADINVRFPQRFLEQLASYNGIAIHNYSLFILHYKFLYLIKLTSMITIKKLLLNIIKPVGQINMYLLRVLKTS